MFGNFAERNLQEIHSMWVSVNNGSFFFKHNNVQLSVVANFFNPSPFEAVAGGSL